MTLVAVRVVVHGRVQGVFFRASTLERALALGLVGWVRNRPDGTVEAHLQGLPEDIDRMTAWCEVGSPLAEVVSVEVTTASLIGDSEFRIRR